MKTNRISKFLAATTAGVFSTVWLFAQEQQAGTLESSLLQSTGDQLKNIGGPVIRVIQIAIIIAAIVHVFPVMKKMLGSDPASKDEIIRLVVTIVVALVFVGVLQLVFGSLS